MDTLTLSLPLSLYFLTNVEPIHLFRRWGAILLVGIDHQRPTRVKKFLDSVSKKVTKIRRSKTFVSIRLPWVLLLPPRRGGSVRRASFQKVLGRSNSTKMGSNPGSGISKASEHMKISDRLRNVAKSMSVVTSKLSASGCSCLKSSKDSSLVNQIGLKNYYLIKCFEIEVFNFYVCF